MAQLESLKQQLIMSQHDLNDIASTVAELSDRISNVQTRVSDALDHLDDAPAGQAEQAAPPPPAEGVGTVPFGKDPVMYLNELVQQGAIQRYTVKVSADGPAHDKMWTVSFTTTNDDNIMTPVAGRVFTASHRVKKQAEKACALLILDEYNELE